MNTENKLKIDNFTKALAECINQAQCAVVDPMAHAEIWKKELLELAKGKEPVSEQKLSNVERIGKNWKEPVSEIDFKQELYKAFGQVKDFTLGMRIAKWFYDMGKNSQEPVSEELEEASKEWLNPKLDKSYANYGEAKMMELTHFDGYAMLDAIEFGAQWQKKRDYIQLSDDINEVARQICNKVLNCEIDYKEDDIVLSDEEECVKAGIRWQMQKESIPSKDLEELINSLSKQFTEVSFAKLSRIAVRVAKWQKEHLWKHADGDDLPIIDREVIALLDNGKIVFAHRPPEYWDGKNIVTGKVTRNYPKTYDKGGWNIPNVKWWLDCLMP